METRTPGRPQTLRDEDVVAVNGATAATKLQKGSDRRAIIDRLVAWGGKASVKRINAYFGYDTRSRLRSLVISGWLSVSEETP